MAETNAQRLKRLRAEAKKEGKCSVCRARPARENRLVCQECIDANKEFIAGNRALGRCRCGRRRRRDKAKCARCLRRDNESSKRLTERKKRDGICLQCTKPNNGTNLCDMHAKQEAEYARQEKSRKRAKGLCAHGGCHSKLFSEWYCEEHLVQMRVYHKEYRTK